MKQVLFVRVVLRQVEVAEDLHPFLIKLLNTDHSKQMLRTDIWYCLLTVLPRVGKEFFLEGKSE